MGEGKSGLGDDGFRLMRLGSSTVRLEIVLAIAVSPLTDLGSLNSAEMNAAATANLSSEMIISISDKLIKNIFIFSKSKINFFLNKISNYLFTYYKKLIINFLINNRKSFL